MQAKEMQSHMTENYLGRDELSKEHRNKKRGKKGVGGGMMDLAIRDGRRSGKDVRWGLLKGVDSTDPRPQSIVKQNQPYCMCCSLLYNCQD